MAYASFTSSQEAAHLSSSFNSYLTSVSLRTSMTMLTALDSISFSLSKSSTSPLPKDLLSSMKSGFLMHSWRRYTMEFCRSQSLPSLSTNCTASFSTVLSRSVYCTVCFTKLYVSESIGDPGFSSSCTTAAVYVFTSGKRSRQSGKVMNADRNMILQRWGFTEVLNCVHSCSMWKYRCTDLNGCLIVVKIGVIAFLSNPNIRYQIYIRNGCIKINKIPRKQRIHSAIPLAFLQQRKTVATREKGTPSNGPTRLPQTHARANTPQPTPNCPLDCGPDGAIQSHYRVQGEVDLGCEGHIGVHLLLLRRRRQVAHLNQSSSAAEEVQPKPEHQGHRRIHQNPPLVIGKSDRELKRLKGMIRTDSQRHINQSIKSGVYAGELNAIITLDQLATKIDFYNCDCKLIRTLKPVVELNERETVILHFAWSIREFRLGLTLKDHSLMFCESQDDFRFQKKFSIATICSDYQTQIWYFEILGLWVTTDKGGNINVWDIEAENISFGFRYKSTLLEMIEVVHLKKVALGAVDKTITIWDFLKQQCLLTIPLENGGVHSLLYSTQYQAIFMSGYEDIIRIYSIDSSLCDHEQVGVLKGHDSMISAIQLIEGTPMLISCDDQGQIRLWDVRILRCLQVFNLGQKANITRILDIGKAVGLIGTRLNILDLEGQGEVVDLYPVKCQMSDQCIIICTKKDIRYYNILSGKLMRIVDGFDEITAFKEQKGLLIIGDVRGEITMQRNNELISKLPEHSDEILAIKIDKDNQLYLTASIDGQVNICKQNEVLREITLHKRILNLDLSIYHNLIAINCTQQIYFTDYDNCKCLSIILLQEEDPVSLIFVNGYSLLVISTNNGTIYVLRFLIRDQAEALFDVLAVMNLNQVSSSYQSPSPSKKRRYSSLFDLSSKKGLYQELNLAEYQGYSQSIGEYANKMAVSEKTLYLSTNYGNIIDIDLQILISIFQLQHTEPHSKLVNYNPYKYLRGDMSTKTRFYVREFVLSNFQNIMKLKKNKKFQAHREPLTHFQIMNNVLLTGSFDGYVKLFNLEGELLGGFSIKHPLPLIWNYKPNNKQKYQQQFSYAIKLLDQLMKMDLSSKEKQAIKADEFFKQGPEPQRKFFQIQTTTMREQYSPKDFQKRQQLPAHLSLKAIEYNKRMNEMHQAWKNEQTNSLEVQNILIEKERLRQQKDDKEIQIAFLEENYHQKLLDIDHNQKRYYVPLKAKLENFQNKKHQDQQRQKEITEISQYQQQISSSLRKKKKKQSDDFYNYATNKNLSEVNSVLHTSSRSQVSHSSTQIQQKTQMKNIVKQLNENLRKAQQIKVLQLPSILRNDDSLSTQF